MSEDQDAIQELAADVASIARCVLARARTPEPRAEMLIALIPHLPEPLQTQALEDVLATTGDIRHDEDRAAMLESVAPYLRRRLLPVLLRAAGGRKAPEPLQPAASRLLLADLPRELLCDALVATGVLKHHLEPERLSARSSAVPAMIYWRDYRSLNILARAQEIIDRLARIDFPLGIDETLAERAVHETYGSVS